MHMFNFNFYLNNGCEAAETLNTMAEAVFARQKAEAISRESRDRALMTAHAIMKDLDMIRSSHDEELEGNLLHLLLKFIVEEDVFQDLSMGYFDEEIEFSCLQGLPYEAFEAAEEALAEDPEIREEFHALTERLHTKSCEAVQQYLRGLTPMNG